MSTLKERFNQILTKAASYIRYVDVVAALDIGQVLRDEGIDFYSPFPSIMEKNKKWLFEALEVKQNPLRKYGLFEIASKSWTYVEVCKTKAKGVVLRKYYHCVPDEFCVLKFKTEYVLTQPLLSSDGDFESNGIIRNPNELS